MQHYKATNEKKKESERETVRERAIEWGGVVVKQDRANLLGVEVYSSLILTFFFFFK